MKKRKSETYKLNYYDETGKRRCKTFSGPTMAVAKIKAEEWSSTQANTESASKSVLCVLNEYIAAKAPVLSPATVLGYKNIVKSCVEGEPIGNIPLAKLSLLDIQTWVSGMTGKSPKTIKNRFALLQSATELAGSRLDLRRIKLPQAQPKDLKTPSTAEITALMRYTAGQKDKTLYRAILLAALGPLRRSEVCAITSDDIHGNAITINKALVKGPDGEWYTKGTKTVKSTRVLVYPDFVIKELKGIQGPIIPINPDALRSRYTRALRFAKLEPFSFHSLRRYGASIMHTLAPDAYVKQRGGWSSNHTMNRVYIKVLDDEAVKTTQSINALFERDFGEVKQKVKQKPLKAL